MATILTGAIVITAPVVWDRINMLSSINPAELINEATVTVREKGVSGLKTWLEAVASTHPDFDIYIVDASKTDLLGRALPERIEQWLVLRWGAGRGGGGSC